MLLRRLPWTSLLLVGCVLVLMAPALRPDATLLTFDPARWEPWTTHLQGEDASPSYLSDHARFVLPRAALLRQALGSGEIPLWNPYSFLGSPFLALWQTEVLYPPNLLLLVFDARSSLAWTVTLHLLIAGLGMLCLGRAIGLSGAAALMSALAFTFGGHMMLRMGQPSFIATLAWIPWCLFAAERFLDSQRARWLPALAMFWALLILAGQATLLVFTGYLVSGWLLARTRRPLQWRTLVVLASALLAGTLLASPQLLATIELSAHSGRANRSLETLERSTMPPLQLLQFMAPEAFGTVRNETSAYAKVLQGDEHARLSFPASVAGYAGSWLPLFAMLGLLGGAWSGRRTLLAVTAIVAVALALGTPLFDLAHRLAPGFRFSVVNRALPLCTLALALLAGRGAQVLAAGGISRRRIAGLGGAWLGLSVGGWMVMRFWWLPQSPVTLMPAAVLATSSRALDQALLVGGLVGTALLATGALLFAPSAGHSAMPPERDHVSTRRTVAWWSIVIVLLAGELLLFAAPYRVVRPRARVFPDTPALTWLGEHTGDYRVARYEKELSGPSQPGLLRANVASLFGLREVGGFAPLHSAEIDTFLEAVGWRRMTAWGVRAVTDPATFASPLFALLNVRHVLTLSGTSLPGMTRVYQGEIDIWEYPSPLPAAFVVDRTVIVANPAAALRRLQQPGFDLRTTATVEDVGGHVDGEADRDGVLPAPLTGDAMDGIAAPLPPLEAAVQGGGNAGIPGERPAETSLPAGTAQVIERTFNRIVLDVDVIRPGWLVLSEAWAPGWEVAVDGATASASVRTNSIFQGVGVPGGLHRVEFTYRPAFLSQGVVGAALGIAMLAGLVFLTRRRTAAG